MAKASSGVSKLRVKRRVADGDGKTARWYPFRFLPLLFLSVLTACRSGGGESDPQERTIRVDFSHDEFASYFLEYYPRKVTLRPGDTAVFKQTWTGEPHSVTMGTMVDGLMALVNPYIERAKQGEPIPDEEPPEVEQALETLPFMIGEGVEDVIQNAAQPCYVDSGPIPGDQNTPCPQREQPDFNGKHVYYNSGFIPYEGPQGNQFRVPLADDIEPGSYFFYCNYHGPLMSGEIEVKLRESQIPSQDEVNRQAREEIERTAAPLREQLEKAKKGELEIPEELAPPLREAGFLTRGTNRFNGNLSGLFSEDESIMGGINEFIPKTLNVRVGQKVDWINLGIHTISFNVPRYFPIISVKEDGTVEYNPRIAPAAGGAPDPPPPFPPGQGEGPPEPVKIDAGAWDGRGFFSSGLIGGEPYVQYSITFSQPGTYKYACLIHPPMTGSVVVR
jgi:plastocyanin